MGTLISSPIALFLLAGVALYFFLRFRVGLDSKAEDIQRGLFDLGQDAQREGLDFLVPLLRAGAVQDISGAIREVKNIAEGLRDPEARKAAMAKVVNVQVKKLLKDPEQYDRVIKLILSAQTESPLAWDELVKRVKEALAAKDAPKEEASVSV